MSFPELLGPAVVLVVVVASLLNRKKRPARPPGSKSAGLAALEAIVEQRGGESATTDLRALLEAARSARETATHGTPPTITATTSEIAPEAGPPDLAEILAVARERKRATPVPETRKSHKKKHREQNAGDRSAPVAQFNGARPPLGARPPHQPLEPMRAMAARAPMHPHSPIAAP